MTTLTLTRTNPLPLIQIIGGSLLLALTSQIVIPLPFSPVPIALHPTIAVLLGILLGPTRGTAAVALYLLEGAVGLPVFAGGMAGLPYMLGPTGGYLVAFAPAAYLGGWLGQRIHKTAALLLGHLPLYLIGPAYLSLFIGWNHVFFAGVLPFLPGCLLKSLGLSFILKKS
jgi:biotin transport system substrate-specific component